MEPAYLFVYGTLRPGSGQPMAKLLAEHARHIGTAKMPGRLYDLGRYPGMVAAQTADDWVAGDLFELNDADPLLARLDEHEGATDAAPRLFERKRGIARLEHSATASAWYYEYQGSIRAEAWIPTGDYATRPMARTPLAVD